MNGLETLQKVKSSHSNTDFIFLSGQRSIDVAIEAMKNGSFDYIVKDNFAKENVVTRIKNLIKVQQLYRQRDRFKLLMIVSIVLLGLSWIFLLVLLALR